MSLLFQLVSWPMFGIALLIFGFAPGAVLRVIVLAFPRNDPRRHELLAEVYAVPMAVRPFWVVQQLEIALTEGITKRLRHTQADVPDISARRSARPLVLTARRHFSLGQIERARQVAAVALAQATEAGDNWSIGWALHVLSIVTANQGQAADALPLLDRAMAVARNDPTLTDLRPLLLVNQAVALGNIDRYESAFVAARQAQQLADQTGLIARQAEAHSALGQLLFNTGQWNEAIAQVEALDDDNKTPATVCCDHGIIAFIHFHRGEAHAARQHLAAAAPYAKQVGNRVIAPFALGRSLDAEHSGASADALAALTVGFTNNAEELEGIEDLLTDGVRLAVRVGNVNTAHILASQAQVLARDTEVLHRRANALYCHGLLGHDPAPLLQAAEYYRNICRPLLRAQALEAAVSVLIDNGDGSSAQDAATRAMEVYVSLDAANDVVRLRTLARTHGIWT